MTLYSIYEKVDLQQASQRGPIAVPERFSWFAAILPPLYALRHGLILALVFWIALVVGLGFAERAIGSEAVFWLYLLVALFFGFEAPALRRDALASSGWIWQGDIIATGEDIAERDYLSLKP